MTEQPIATMPTCGRLVEVRVGARWFPARWGMDAETGVLGVFARLSVKGEWWPVEAAAWRERPPRVGATSSRLDSPSPAVRRPVRPLASGVHEAVPLAAVIKAVQRALLTLKSLPDPEWRFLTAGSRVAWPPVIYEFDEKREQERQAAHDPPPRRFQPSRADIEGMDAALELFRTLNLPPGHRALLIRAGRLPFSHEQMLVWWDALGFSNRWISRRTGQHHENVRRHLAGIYERLWHRANAAAAGTIHESVPSAAAG